MGESSSGVDFELLALYFLDSKDRQIINKTTGEKQPLNNFTVVNNCQLNKISYWGLIETDINIVYDNINAYNNILILDDNTGHHVLTFTIGVYPDNTTLLTYLQSVFTPLGYTLSLSHATQLNIVKNDSTNFTLKSGSITPALLYMMGFSLTLLTGANSYSGDLNFNIYYTRYVDICSPTLMRFSVPAQSSRSNTNGSLIKRINLISASGNLGTLQGTYIDNLSRIMPKYKWDNSTQLGQIDIKLFDEWGIPFDMYSDFTMRFALFKNVNSNDNLGMI